MAFFEDVFEGVKDIFEQGRKGIEKGFKELTGEAAFTRDVKKLKRQRKRGAPEVQLGPTEEERARMRRLLAQRRTGRAGTLLTSRLSGTLLGGAGGTEKTLLGL